MNVKKVCIIQKYKDIFKLTTINYQSNGKLNSEIFDLRKSNFSAVSGKSFDLLTSKIRPAEAKSLSTAVDVGGVFKYLNFNIGQIRCDKSGGLV